jgi:hypothetical protein
MRLSRPCYDKITRCPGWNGGGPKFARRQRCDNGHILTYDPATDLPLRGWLWRFLHCDTCDVVTWPYMTRYLSVPWLAERLRWKISDRKYRRRF